MGEACWEAIKKPPSEAVAPEQKNKPHQRLVRVRCDQSGPRLAAVGIAIPVVALTIAVIIAVAVVRDAILVVVPLTWVHQLAIGR